MNKSLGRVDALLTRAMSSRYVPNVIAAMMLVCSICLMQTSYWRFEYLWELKSPYPHEGGLPLLELTPIGMVLFGAFGTIIGATASIGLAKGRAVRLSFGSALFMICLVFPLIYVRYGIVPPYDLADHIVTVIFFAVYFAVSVGVVCTITSWLEEKKSVEEKTKV